MIAGRSAHIVRFGDRAAAERLGAEARGLDRSLDAWLDCLGAEGMFGPGTRTATELETRCPFPPIRPAPTN